MPTDPFVDMDDDRTSRFCPETRHLCRPVKRRMT
jgi:hypothetical protein